MPDTTPEKEIILFADPMCSWCWGFSPVMAALIETYADSARPSLVLGGLRPGTTEVMDDRDKATVRHHWEDVGRMTRQPFTFAFFERQGFVYDTEPACRAAVTVRGLAPDRAFAYLDALHRAFYVDNRDVTDGAVLADVALPFGVDGEAFTRVFESDAVRAETLADFQQARGLGIAGYPTVVLKDGRGLVALTVGYRPLEDLASPLETWLAA
jgi:putative protein-disulfide isomerase